MSNKLIRGTPEAWESGELGASLAHAKRAPSALEAQVDEAMGLQAISIRLPRSVIAAYKHLADHYGVGYQPLMRDAICRWAEAEMKHLSARTSPAHPGEHDSPSQAEARNNRPAHRPARNRRAA